MRARLMLVVAAAAAGACAGHAPAPSSDPSTASDTLRGVVERAGNEPGSALIVRASAGVACAIFVREPQPSLAGLEITVWGTRQAPSPPIPGIACAIAVERYAVRAVDGITALDGVLRFDGGAYSLETTDGVRHSLRAVPTALRAQVGARIFWAGPLERAPEAYGVLAPPIA